MCNRFLIVQGSISLVKDVICLTTHTEDLFIEMKVCVEPAKLFGWADNRRMVHKCVIDSHKQQFLGFELSEAVYSGYSTLLYIFW